MRINSCAFKKRGAISVKRKKVLLLTLGTGNATYQDLSPDTVSKLSGNKTILQAYKDTEYQINGKEIHATMVAAPIIREVEPDIVFFVGTVRSAWTSLYSTFVRDEIRSEEIVEELSRIEKENGKDTDEITLSGVQKRIQKIFDEAGILHNTENHHIECARILLIKYGLNDEELQFNYQKLSEIGEWMRETETEYEVSFDVTHSFRSLPIYNLVILNYLKTLSSARIEIKHVFYGMLEVRSENHGTAPILDLADIAGMMDLTTAVAEFQSTGNVKGLFQYIPEGDENIRQELQLFDWAVQTNDLNRLENSLQALMKYLDVSSTSRYGDLYSMLRDSLNRSFPGKEEFNDLNDIQRKMWAYGNIQRKIGLAFLNQGRYGQALVIGTEALSSYVIPYYLMYKEKRKKITFLDCRSRVVQEKVKNSIYMIGKSKQSLPYKDLFGEELVLLKKLKEQRNMFAHFLLKNDSTNAGSEYSLKQVNKTKELIDSFYNKMWEIDQAMRNDPQGMELLFQHSYEKKSSEKTQTAKPSEATPLPKKKKMESVQREKGIGVIFSNKTWKRLDNDPIRIFRATGVSKSKKSLVGILEDGSSASIQRGCLPSGKPGDYIGSQMEVKMVGKKTYENMAVIPIEMLEKFRGK